MHGRGNKFCQVTHIDIACDALMQPDARTDQHVIKSTHFMFRIKEMWQIFCPAWSRDEIIVRNRLTSNDVQRNARSGRNVPSVQLQASINRLTVVRLEQIDLRGKEGGKGRS